MTLKTKTTKPKPVRVQLRYPGGTVERHLLPAIEGRWLDLPEQLPLRDLNTVGHMVDGYALAKNTLREDESALVRRLRRNFDETGIWWGTATELLAAFFLTVRGWRGLYRDPEEGDDYHREAQALYGSIRRRLREHPDEVRLLAAKPDPLDGAR